MTTNRHYKNGANFERRVKARLEEDGWTVFRVAGSHTPADLVAMRLQRYKPDWRFYVDAPRVSLVQCKGGVGTLGPKGRREFAAYATELGADAILAERGMKLSRLDAAGERTALA